MKSAIWAAILLAVTVSTATENQKAGDSQSCRAFVESFYDWYVPLANREGLKGPASDLALKNKKSLFSETLYQALKTDSEAQARSNELVGLDFDPFLGGQDPDSHYQVRAIKEAGNHCSAEVFGIGNSEKGSRPDVVAELVHAGHTWIFADFRYPRYKTDLLRVLNQLAEDRRKSTR